MNIDSSFGVRPSSFVSRFSGYAFLLPYLVLFVSFMVLPLIYGLILSMTSYEMLFPEPPRFVGLDNYAEAIADPYFWNALRATGLFVVLSVPVTVGTALLLAVAVEQTPDRRQEIYRLCIFLPTMITITVAGLVWRWFYHSDFGVFNEILDDWFGIRVPWLSDPAWAMPSIVLMTLWWTVGGPMVILLAGIKQIPQAYYEAAAIDGATGWRRFVHITLPLLRPVLLFVMVINVIGAFQVFGQTFIITGGGPEHATRVLVQYIYETAFNHYRLGYGAAMSWLLFLVIAVFSLLQFKVLRER